jgi:hypothetical protein
MNSPPIAAKSLEFPMELFEIASVLILCRAAICLGTLVKRTLRDEEDGEAGRS